MVRTTALHTVHKHRWILVVPFVFLMVFFTVREGRVRMDAHVADAGSGTVGQMRADEGTRYTVADDDAFVLEAGGLLVDAPGIATVRAGDWTVSVWGGGAYVSFQRAALTVAALDVPVIVRGSRGVVVVPAMRQWTDQKVVVPDPAGDPVAWMQAVETSPLPAFFTVERLTELHALRSARGTHTVAQDYDETDVRSVAFHALSARPTRAVAGAMRIHADLRLYALVHPVVRDAAWAFRPTEGEIDTETWVALLSLPVLTSTETSASPLTARIWGETVRRAVSASAPSDDGLLSRILPSLEARIVATASGGYPLRALQFARALHAAVGTGDVLTDDAQSSYERLKAMTPETLRASVIGDASIPVESPAREAAPSPVSVLADPALEQHARDRLVARGGMLTSGSSFTAVGSGTVEVRDVIFGLPGGDRALWFVYDVDGDVVRAVVDAVVQPYAVPFDAYMAWERTR